MGPFRKILLICGILSSLLYIGMNALIPFYDHDYQIASQAVSELSAIGAPTRALWMKWVVAYSLLLVAFGVGVKMTNPKSKYLRVMGLLIICHAIFGIFWPPMHTREILAAGGGTTTDTLHIAWTFVTVPLFLAEVMLGAAAFGKGFRIYSAITILIIMTFGILTGMQSGEMEANLPTPWMGIWERISIGGYMLWVIVLAAMLLRKEISHEAHPVSTLHQAPTRPLSSR